MNRTVLIISALLLHSLSGAGVERYKPQIIKEFRHDPKAYTQGLFFNNGILYESTGQWGESSIRTVELSTGAVTKKINFAAKYFGEGSTILNGKLYVLTWTNKVAFIYDAESFKYLKSFSYPREGWGLTTDGKELIASDGSSTLYFLDENLQLKQNLKVTLNGKPVRLLNELEWIDGRIWANVYTTDLILIINPENGITEGLIDCSGLLPDNLKTPDTDVLNGIAVNDGRIYLTGKNWPRVYEIRLQRIK